MVPAPWCGYTTLSPTLYKLTPSLRVVCESAGGLEGCRRRAVTLPETRGKARIFAGVLGKSLLRRASRRARPLSASPERCRPRASRPRCRPVRATVAEPELAALLDPPVGLGRRAQAAGEPDLAERREPRRAPAAPRAAEAIASAIPRSAPGSSMRTPPATLTNTSAPPSGKPGVPGEHGDDHREPLRVDAGADPARHRQVGRRDERLDLEQQRPRALERAGDRGADLAAPRCGRRAPRGPGTPTSPVPVISKTRELVRRAEAVLRRAQDAVGVVAVALELEHAVDEVLEHARAGDGAVLRHVTDEERRDAGLLRDPQEPRRGLANLRDRAGRRAELGRVERLHRVDHADVGPLALERRADGVELGLGEDLDRARSRRAAPRGASPARPTPRR